MFTMHGTTMTFFVVMPLLFGFGTYLVPLSLVPHIKRLVFPSFRGYRKWKSELIETK
jgi:cytochrome c oxidase subunit I